MLLNDNMNENKNYQQRKWGPHSQVRQVPLYPIFQFPVPVLKIAGEPVASAGSGLVRNFVKYREPEVAPTILRQIGDLLF